MDQFDAYQLADPFTGEPEEVTHGGKYWRVSEGDGAGLNVSEPGVFGWIEIDADGNVIEPEPGELPDRWVQGGGTGTAGSYIMDALVVHDRPQDGGNDWVFRSKLSANTTEPSRDSTFDRWWEPVSRASEYVP
jgi:hypothetical protein